jgi:transcriptional regulator of acetoin/glycerol metabolism
MTTGTLIATDLAGTPLEQQHVFLDWLGAHHAVRIITLSETPLYDLVRDGAMIETLYYRLNPIYCALDPNCRSGSVDSSSAA